MNLRRLFYLPLVLFALSASELVFATQVNGLRVWRAPDHTRVVFDLSGPVEYKLFPMSKPDRIVIDLAKSDVKKGFDQVDLANTPIIRVRYGRQAGGTLRVVFDLREKVKARSFILKKHGNKLDRLVIDLEDVKSKSDKLKPIITEATKARRDILVAIDAGHGGEDPGAVGPNKMYEKRVVLSIAKRLKALLDAQEGYSAYMVRTGDYYIGLSKRREKAREIKADLFISIHADAFRHPSARGVSVYALSEKGATSEEAQFLADKENQADKIGGHVNGDDSMLMGVIYDLLMTATMSDSLEVGADVLKEMGKIARIHKKQVEQANFVVLKAHDVPSILVETGFISNPYEAKKLATQSYRNFLAKAIFDGVKNYFTRNPPTRATASEKPVMTKPDIEYVIVRGDTLSEIAKRYKVSVNRIIKHNNLKSVKIRVGQKIRIPTG